MTAERLYGAKVARSLFPGAPGMTDSPEDVIDAGNRVQPTMSTSSSTLPSSPISRPHWHARGPYDESEFSRRRPVAVRGRLAVGDLL
jgi:hypothetical protein